MSTEKELAKPISKELKSDIQQVIDTCWKSSGFIALRSEYRDRFRQDGIEVTPKQAAYHCMAVFDIHLAMRIGHVDGDQYVDILASEIINDDYKTAAREVIGGIAQLLGFENSAFNQSIVAMVLLSTVDVRDLRSIDFALIPSPWSVVRSAEDGEERLDSRIEGKTSAREDREAAKFYKAVRGVFSEASRVRKGWGEESGARVENDFRAIEFFELYEKLKDDPSLKNKDERYGRIAEEKGYQRDTVGKLVSRGRKLA